MVYKNVIGTYLHGPLLPKNPQLADWLIAHALEQKYGKEVQLAPLDDTERGGKVMPPFFVRFYSFGTLLIGSLRFGIRIGLW